METKMIVNDRIEKVIEEHLPNGAGILTETQLRAALEQVAHVAWTAAESHVLINLMTVEDVSEQLGISPRRVRAIAIQKHQRFGIGWKLPGNRGTWLFKPEEVAHLQPGPGGWPKGRVRK